MTSTADKCGFGPEGIAAALLGLCLVGCSARASDEAGLQTLSEEPQADSSEAGERPSALRIESGGGLCAYNCWFAAEITWDGEFILEDELGAESFSVTREELDALWSVAGRPEMMDALQDADDCYAANGYSRVVSLTWSNGSSLVDETAMSCTASGSTHPYRLVYEQILTLAGHYLDCSSRTDGKGLGALCLAP
jgi:hypothetical protein